MAKYLLESSSVDAYLLDANVSSNYVVSVTADDARNLTPDGTFTGTAATHHLGNFTGSIYASGWRFNNVQIPQGATITKAPLTMYVSNVNGGTTANVKFYGNAVDNATTFANVTADKPEGKTRTTASVSQTFTTANWATVGYQTNSSEIPDLAPIIQEIVNRPGWVPGNSIVITAVDNGSTSPGYVGYATFDNAANKATQLSISYADSGYYLLDGNEKTSTLVDNFNDNSPDATKWTVGGTNTTITETGCQVSISTVTTGAGYAQYTSLNLYDLTEDSTFIQLTNAGDQSLAHLETYWQLQVDNDNTNRVFFLVSSGILGFYQTVNGTQTKIAQVTYDPAIHKFLRFRQSGTTLYFDTSVNGTTWTQQASATNPINLSKLRQVIIAGNWGVDATATTITFDNLNTVPSALVTVTKPHTTDTYKSTGTATFSRTHTTDFLKRKAITKTHTTDTYKKGGIWSSSVMAWFYPGPPATNATAEYSDGRKIHFLKPEYQTVNSSGAIITKTAATYGIGGYTQTNAQDVVAKSDYAFYTISGGYADVSLLLASSTTRNAAVTAILNFLNQLKVTDSAAFDGVELDWEGFASWTATDYVNYKTFVTSLADSLHAAGYQLMIDGPPIGDTTEQSYYLWKYEDFNSLPVDYIVAMAYDWQFDFGGGSSVSPTVRVQNVCDWVKSKITDINRIVIGMPSYGYHAATGGYGITIDTKTQSSAFTGYATATRNADFEMHWTNAGIEYFYMDSQSLDSKRQIIEAKGIKYISVWHLGGNAWFASKSEGVTLGTRQHTTSSYIQKAATAKAHTTDTLKRSSGTKTHTTDTFTRRSLTRTHTVDALKRLVPVRSFTTDSLKRRVSLVSHTVSANKRKATFVSHFADANKRRSYSVAHLTSSNLKRASALSHLTNTNKRKTTILAHLTDANKKKALTVSHATDMLLRERFPKNKLYNGDFEIGSGTTNSNFNVPGWEINTASAGTVVSVDTSQPNSGTQAIKITIDASNTNNGIKTSTYAKVSIGSRNQLVVWAKSDTAGQLQIQLRDGYLSGNFLQSDGVTWNTNPSYFNINTTTSWTRFTFDFVSSANGQVYISDLKRSGATGSQAGRSFFIDDIQILTGSWHYADALKRKNVSVSHTTNLLKRRAFSLSHTTNVNVRKAVSVSHVTDSNKRKTSNLTHSVDANKRRAYATSHTTDAFIGYQTTFVWKGLTWQRRSVAGGPAYNQQWDINNVIGPDSNDYVTLRISNPTGSNPSSAEMMTIRQGFGYGTYKIVVGSRLDLLSSQAVFGGLFTYDGSTPIYKNEIDVNETSAWGGSVVKTSHNYWFSNGGSLANTDDPYNTTSDPVTTHILIWEPTRLIFRSFAGTGTGGTLLRETIVTSNVPTPATERLYINAWVTAAARGTSVASTTPQTDIVLRDLSFVPTYRSSHTTDVLKRRAITLQHTTDSSKHGAQTTSHTISSNKRKSNTTAQTTDAFTRNRRKYSYEAHATLPTDNADLDTLYTDTDITNASANDTAYTCVTGNGYLLHLFKHEHSNNTDTINLNWIGKSTTPTSSVAAYLQIWNINTSTWDTVASDNNTPASTDFSLSAVVTAVANYYSGNTISVRVYQGVV